MAIPPLDERGLLPAGEHGCRLDEVPPRFCVNDHRTALWGSLCNQFIPALRANDLGPEDARMVVGGSFFSDKPQPADIEATLVFPDDTPDAECWKSIVLWKHNHTRWKDAFRIDYYPTLPGNNNFALYFGYVGPKTAEAKGLNEKDLRGTLALETW